MNSKSLSLFLPEGTMLPPTTVKPRYAENSKYFSILSYVSSSSVGWGRPISRLGGAPERHPDVMAPHHRQALPHTAVWVLQPRHPGGSSWGSAEPGCWQLEGKNSVLCLYPCDTKWLLHKTVLKFKWDLNVSNIDTQQNSNNKSPSYSGRFVLWDSKPYLLALKISSCMNLQFRMYFFEHLYVMASISYFHQYVTDNYINDSGDHFMTALDLKCSFVMFQPHWIWQTREQLFEQ